MTTALTSVKRRQLRMNKSKQQAQVPVQCVRVFVRFHMILFCHELHFVQFNDFIFMLALVALMISFFLVKRAIHISVACIFAVCVCENNINFVSAHWIQRIDDEPNNELHKTRCHTINSTCDKSKFQCGRYVCSYSSSLFGSSPATDLRLFLIEMLVDMKNT